MSYISSQLEKTGGILQKSASNQITDYNRRFESLRKVYEMFLGDLIVSLAS